MCESNDADQISAELARAKPDHDGNRRLAVTCLNENQVPVRIIYKFDPANDQISVTEHSLPPAERAGAFLRSRNGEYVFATAIGITGAVLLHRTYTSAQGWIKPLGGVFSIPKRLRQMKDFKSVLRGLRFYQNTSTGKVTKIVELRMGEDVFNFEISRKRSVTRTVSGQSAYNPQSEDGPIIDGTVVERESAREP